MFSLAALLITLACPPLAACTVPSDTTPRATLPMVADTVHRRARAIEVSDAYALRLRIHHLASYTTIPLFVAQTVAGNQLYQADKSGAPKPGWATGTHAAGAVGLGVLFTVNTVTGAWNLWDSRHNKVGRTKRLIHSALMLASDAGFAYAGASGGGDDTQGLQSARAQHRNIAYVSMGVALAGYGVMLVGKQ